MLVRESVHDVLLVSLRRVMDMLVDLSNWRVTRRVLKRGCLMLAWLGLNRDEEEGISDGLVYLS